MAKGNGGSAKAETYLGEMFDRFAKKAATTVMVRATMENALAPEDLDELFGKVAERQYTRELLFSTLVALMVVVVCRVQQTVRAAYKEMEEDIPVSLTALYKKLDGTEPAVSAALVRHTGARMRAVIEATGGALPPLFPGYRVKILDGAHLAAAQRRLKVLRRCKAGPLPGFGLVVLDPALMLAIEFIPCEDGHAQERSLTPQILAVVEPRDLFIMDRNFCTVPLLFGIARNGFFIVRQHASLPWTAVGPERDAGRTATGRVTEQEVTVPGPEEQVLHLRRITLHLEGYTRDGDSELHMLTNLPADIPATAIAEGYRNRWTIESLFAEMERNLDGEIDTLCYPKAALFAFATALVAHNVLSTTKAAMRAQHGAEKVEQGLSAYYVADEISRTYCGMMIAVPEPQWHHFRSFTPAQLAALLVRLAANVQLRRLAKKRCGPRPPRLARLRYRNKTHVSIARLLAAQPRARRAR
jgi:hypothetical protein